MNRCFDIRLLALVVLFFTRLAFAGVEVHKFDTPEQEHLYKELIAELRCLVCQNQNLEGSNADLAKDLRRQTYEMVEQGKDKPQIVDYMVQRYGEFVLYRPPVQSNTILLWGGPFLILLVATVVLVRVIRNRARQSQPDISSTELDKAKELLGIEGEDR